MLHQMKSAGKSALGRLGYTIQKSGTADASAEDLDPGFICGFLSGVLAKQGTLGLIQCGANDGLTVDPLVSFMQENIASVNAVLIEPLPDVFEALAGRYAAHDNVTTMNTAIGPDGTIDLFRIKPAYAEHYKGIIASGITSFNRDYVLRKAETLLDLENVPPEDRIEKLTIETTSITRILEQNQDTLGSAPFIQIDTEGFDDQVIYTVDFDRFRPIAISYEFCHLVGEKRQKLHSHLAAHGYRIIQWSKDDEIAILTT